MNDAIFFPKIAGILLKIKLPYEKYKILKNLRKIRLYKKTLPEKRLHQYSAEMQQINYIIEEHEIEISKNQYDRLEKRRIQLSNMITKLEKKVFKIM